VVELQFQAGEQVSGVRVAGVADPCRQEFFEGLRVATAASASLSRRWTHV